MSIIQENIRRNLILDAYYNPLTGEGSTIGRQTFELSDLTEKLYLPVSMLNVPWIAQMGEYGSMGEYMNREKAGNPLLQVENPMEVLQDVFLNERLNADFEYFCATCVKIKPKKGGEFISFVLNHSQRLLFKELDDLMSNLLPILFILVKSRQFGGSTLIQILMAYIQIRLKTNWNSLIAAHVNQQSANVRSMLANLIVHYPQELGPVTLRPFESTHNIKIIPERSNKITIGSMQTPESIRSDDVKMAHLTEVASWRKTDGKEPEDLCQSILGTIPIDEPYVMYGLESTAKGVGNYFHRTWQQALKGENALKPIFISWLQDHKNRIQFKKTENKEEFASSFSDYDRFLWDKGATLEGIKFYHKQLSLFNGDKWRMQSEFPTTADEAFQSTGNRFFPQQYVLAMRKDNKPPIWKGELIGDGMKGKKALENLHFDENNQGNLWVWEFPDTNNEYDFRYVVSLDIGGTTSVADYSIIRAIDRLPMLSGGDPVAILTWKGHLDQDLLAWRGIQIAKMCDNALFVPEDNSFDRDKEEDGEHFQTILYQIKDDYRNIYIRNDEERVGNDFVPKYGFNTNKKTKGLMLDDYRAAARERMNKDLGKQDWHCYIEPDGRVCDEMDCYEIKQDGKLGATDGNHDDFVMSTGINVHICLDVNKLPLPRLRRQEIERKVVRKRSESSIF